MTGAAAGVLALAHDSSPAWQLGYVQPHAPTSVGGGVPSPGWVVIAVGHGHW